MCKEVNCQDMITDTKLVMFAHIKTSLTKYIYTRIKLRNHYSDYTFKN